MSNKTGLPAFVRWHKGHPRYQRADRFGGASKRIRAPFPSPEFWQAYEALQAEQLPEGYGPPARRELSAAGGGRSARGAKGSFRWGADLYLHRADQDERFIARVRAKKVGVINAFAESVSPRDPTRTPRGHWPIEKIDDENLRLYLAECQRTGDVGRYNLHFDALKPLFEWFCKTSVDGKRLRTTLSPLHGMSRKVYRTEDGRKKMPFAWSQQHVEAYRARHPVGTKARLAFDLIYYLWIRRSDVTRMGPQNLIRFKGEWYWDFTEFKGARSEDPKAHRWPCEPELKASIDAYTASYKRAALQDARCARVFLTYIGTGRWVNKDFHGDREVPYYDNDNARFNVHFREWCDQAGLPAQCTAHGIRRGEAVEAAHQGDDINRIRAQLGHTKIAQTETYLRHQIDDRLVASRLSDAGSRRQPKAAPAKLRVIK